MSSFTAPLRVEITQREREGRTLARLLEPFSYFVGGEGSADVVIVPRDFETDFASVPWLFRRIFPALGPWAKAAVVHDYLYANRLRPREDCDAVFYEAMGVLGVPQWKRSLMHGAVRVFGGKGYGE
jgi:hypothetical protein